MPRIGAEPEETPLAAMDTKSINGREAAEPRFWKEGAGAEEESLAPPT